MTTFIAFWYLPFAPDRGPIQVISNIPELFQDFTWVESFMNSFAFYYLSVITILFILFFIILKCKDNKDAKTNKYEVHKNEILNVFYPVDGSIGEIVVVFWSRVMLSLKVSVCLLMCIVLSSHTVCALGV